VSAQHSTFANKVENSYKSVIHPALHLAYGQTITIPNTIKEEWLMETVLTVTFCKYNTSTRYLKIFYNNGLAELYHPVPEFIYNNLLRSHDKAAFVQKYLEYDLHFNKVSLRP